MQACNHLAGGLVFTGLFASFHDVNILAQPPLLATTLGLALLPDIDHTRSLVGKLVYPLAHYLQSRFGHRTVTHSVFFFLAGWLLLALLPRAYTIAGTYALGSHLLFDMCTRAGIPLLFPFSRRAFVLPANPAWRLAPQDHRAELLVLLGFLTLGLFGRPLFNQGFWTTYNQAFATWEHVEREARRSHDLIRVYYRPPGPRRAEPTTDRSEDLDPDVLQGLYLKTEGTTMILITPEGFAQVPRDQQPLVRLEHSGITLQQQQLTVTDISLDSLNHLLRAHCTRIQVQSAGELLYFDGPLRKSGRLLDLQYRKNLLLSENTPEGLPQDGLPLGSADDPVKIRLLEIQRQEAQAQYRRAYHLYLRDRLHLLALQEELDSLAGAYPAASDFGRGEIIRRRRELTARLTTAQASEPLPPLAPHLEKYDLPLAQLRRGPAIRGSGGQTRTSAGPSSSGLVASLTRLHLSTHKSWSGGPAADSTSN